jgi:hypothetical protein
MCGIAGNICVNRMSDCCKRRVMSIAREHRGRGPDG